MTKLTGEKEGLVTALIAAIVGTVITLVWIRERTGSTRGGFVWLLALKALYKIGWLKALLIAIIVWILAALVGFVLPTLTGPF